MNDDTVYLIYNTNAKNVKLQKQPVRRGGFDWEYKNEDSFTIIYNPEDVRKSTEIKVHSKTKLRDRPKSAGEVMTLPKINAEGILIKKSISLSNIEDFFLKRRIPLIKPLLSEREILKLQLLQEQCRKKRAGIETDRSSLKSVDIEDKDLQKYKGLQLESEEGKLKDTAKDVTSPLFSTTDKSKEDKKKPGDKRQQETEGDKKAKSPVSGKSGHEAKKLKKETTFSKPKSEQGKEKKKDKPGTSKEKKEKPAKILKEKSEKSKKEKQRQSLKDKSKNEIPGEGGQKTAKKKAKTSLSESGTESKPKKRDSKTKDQTKSSKSKESNESKKKKSGESMKHEDFDKTGSKGSSRKSSKQRLKSEQSDKDVQSKKTKDHSKERVSLGKKSEKSDKSDKSESNKSRKTSDSSKKRKEKDKDGKEIGVEEQNEKNASQPGVSGDKRKVSEDASKITEHSKKDKDKKTKPGTPSDRTSGPLSKEKTSKSDAEGKTQKMSKDSGGKSVKFPSGGKSVKFPNIFQHVIHYVLSNPTFVKLGWTLAASDRAQLQLITFRAVPVTPNTYCFRERTEDEIKYYSSALENVAFHFRMDGTGEIFYPSGVRAATITKHSTGMRLTLYSDPENDALIPDSFNSKVLGIFDTYGNGVVYDMEGKKLLNYNQLEGIFCSPHRKSPYKWQWCDYKILDKQRLKALLRYMAKEQKQPVSSKRVATPVTDSPKKPKSEEKKAEIDEAYEQILAELPYPVPQKPKTKSDNHVWGFKPITLKINREMTLRINGQDNITINFLSNQIFLRIDLGVKVDPDVVERIEALTPKITSDVPCVFDGLLELSPSLQKLTAPPTRATVKNKLSAK